MDGYYYLHTNGDLIYKRFCPETDSPFVKKIWPVDTTDRGNAWQIALEAIALGANHRRIREISKKWKLTFVDSYNLLRYIKPTELMKNGLTIFIEKILNIKEEVYWNAIKYCFDTEILYKCPGIEVESTVFSGCKGMSDCPVCEGTGILFRCPVCGEDLAQNVCKNGCWFPHRELKY